MLGKYSIPGYVRQDKATRERYEAELKYQLDFNTAIHSEVQKIAKNMKDFGMSIDQISEVTGLPIQEIKQLNRND